MKAGLIAEPAVKRIIMVNLANVQMDTVAQRVTTNEFDASLDMLAQAISGYMSITGFPDPRRVAGRDCSHPAP